MKPSGFTLIEMLAVLVLVSILAAVAVPRLPVGTDFDDALQARNLTGLLRLVQLRAMNDPQALQSNTGTHRCGVLAVTATGVSISSNCQHATLLSDLNDTGQTLWLGAKLPVTASRPLPFTLQFGEVATDPAFLSDASYLGRPFIDGSRLTETLQMTLAGKTVLIEPEGYVHAQP